MLSSYDTWLMQPFEEQCALADAYEAAQDAVTDEERDYLSLSALAEADGPVARCIHCGDQFTPPYPGCDVCGECDRAEAEAARRYEYMTREPQPDPDCRVCKGRGYYRDCYRDATLTCPCVEWREEAERC